MKISKKLRAYILNQVAEISMQKLEEYCPETKSEVPPDQWDYTVKARYDLITDVTAAVEKRLLAKLCALS